MHHLTRLFGFTIMIAKVKPENGCYPYKNAK
jgi:hypothetical protein